MNAAPTASLAMLPAGILVGVAACALAHAASGRLEPFDSGLGMGVTQAVLGAATFFAGWWAGGGVLALLLAGSYVGINGYLYVLGGSESRAWASLGALTSLALLVLPAVLGAVGFLIGRMRGGATR